MSAFLSTIELPWRGRITYMVKTLENDMLGRASLR
jgi:hypothetical protein